MKSGFLGLVLALGVLPLSAEDLDARVVMDQSLLNKFLQAIGPLSAKGRFDKPGFPPLTVDYTWTVSHPRIEINPGVATFSGDVVVQSGAFQYNTTAKGAVSVRYDEAANTISVKVEKASFEVTADVLGNKIHITDVDISQYYKPEFQFHGPQPLQKTVAVKLPDGKTKEFLIQAHPKLSLEKGSLVVGAAIQFENK